ncbi:MULTISPECIES: helix-turn-helix domain-containing protein [Streptomyces]|uniref:helix-turn-helix domain-containing protein n=1 Tax=Streptomyces TaxID=1883 RepID=UPI001D0380F1|nr:MULTISPECIES: helix-turn-helix transcriptional regulator [Streptomyces]
MGESSRDNRPAEELAARLGALKERSGLSFGALAKRLHTSTSTLHRYCSGAVVPAEYAPVERLASACGARPDELLALHRLWLSADDARSRPAAEPRAAEAAARAEPTAPEAAAPEPAAAAPAAAPPAGRSRRRRPWSLVLVLLLVGTLGGWGVWNARPSGGGSAAAQANQAARDAGSPGDEPAPPDAAGPGPLEYSVRSHVWAEGCAHRYLVDRAPDAVPPPPVAQDAEEWAARLGAVHGDATILEATVTATGEQPVVVEAMHVRVTERRRPLAWSAYDMSMGCGGALTPAAFEVDLDAERPQPTPRDGYDAMSERELTAPRLPFAVTAREPLALRIEARAAACDCDWFVELEWSSGGERGTLRLDDGGVPFRTSGGGAGEAWQHQEELGGWSRG